MIFYLQGVNSSILYRGVNFYL